MAAFENHKFSTICHAVPASRIYVERNRAQNTAALLIKFSLQNDCHDQSSWTAKKIAPNTSLCFRPILYNFRQHPKVLSFFLYPPQLEELPVTIILTEMPPEEILVWNRSQLKMFTKNSGNPKAPDSPQSLLPRPISSAAHPTQPSHQMEPEENPGNSFLLLSTFRRNSDFFR